MHLVCFRTCGSSAQTHRQRARKPLQFHGVAIFPQRGSSSSLSPSFRDLCSSNSTLAVRYALMTNLVPPTLKSSSSPRITYFSFSCASARRLKSETLPALFFLFFVYGPLVSVSFWKTVCLILNLSAVPALFLPSHSRGSISSPSSLSVNSGHGSSWCLWSRFPAHLGIRCSYQNQSPTLASSFGDSRPTVRLRTRVTSPRSLSGDATYFAARRLRPTTAIARSSTWRLTPTIPHLPSFLAARGRP